MTLERWSVTRYHLPHLAVDAIRRIDNAVEVDSSRGVFTLTCDDAELIDRELLPTLHALRNPRSSAWTVLRDADAAGSFLPMLRELDHLGLIRESRATDVGAANAAIERAVRDWSAELGRELAADGARAVELANDIAQRMGSDRQESMAATLADASFAVVTLLLQARYLRHDAPAVLALIVEGLRAAVRCARDGEDVAWWYGLGESMPHDWECGLLELRVVQQYLSAVGTLLRQSYETDATRRVRPQWQSSQSFSGINFLIELEGHVAGLLAAMGESPAVAAVRDPALAREVIRWAFLQEYFVTCRYVEIVAPLLSKRFADPLRNSIHSYFAEEMGHEQFERGNCMHLGWSEEQIDGSGPLPLHLAYIDILTAVARESPVLFFSMSMFTEGLIGSGHSLVSLALEAIPDDPMLIRAISDHTAVNEESDHRGVGRDWMSRVPVVPPRLGAEVSEFVVYVAELNWRMWEELTIRASRSTDTRPRNG